MEENPNELNYWRGVILFGKNQSSYKIGLGKLLLQYGSENRDTVSLEDLSVDFLNLYLDRCQNNKPQQPGVGMKTYVEHEIDAIRYRKKDISEAAQFIKKHALSDMVLQRFNNLFGRKIAEPFYTFEPGDKFIVLNKNLLKICDVPDDRNILDQELLSRWDLLEHAFERSHPVQLHPDERLEYLMNWQERKNLTKLVPLLGGYQQGRCFYCGEVLYDVHVDHVIPYSAILHNEIWNLVLAHEECNEQKLDTLPSWAFLEKLIARNEYYISSAHPLKDEIIKNLGNTPRERREKIRKQYDDALKYKMRHWGGNPHYDPSQDKEYLFWVKHYAKRV